MTSDEPRIQLAHALWEVGAFLDKTAIRPNNPDGRGFRLKLHETQPDAPLSPYFLNLRTKDNPKPGPLTPEIVALAGQVLHRLAADNPLVNYDHVAGVPNAGDPFADAFSAADPEGRIPVLRLGKEVGPGGRKVTSIIDGEYEELDLVLLVDDLITKADSKIEALDVLGAECLIVDDVLVLVDREQGGSEQLDAQGVSLHAVFTTTELLDLYVETGKMSPALRAEIKAYMSANG